MARLAGARQRGDTALRGDLADTVVPRVSHDGVADAVHCDPTGKAKLCTAPLLAVSMALPAGARQSVFLCGTHCVTRLQARQLDPSLLRQWTSYSVRTRGDTAMMTLK